MSIDKATKIIVTAATVGTLLISIYTATQTNNNSAKIEEVHISINSRMDQLLTERGKSSKAEGVTQERARKDAVDEKSDTKP